MSISLIERAKVKIAKSIKKAANKTADAIAATGQLSPMQADEVDRLRKDYLSSLSDMSDENTQEFIQRNLGAIGIETFREYLPQIEKLYLPVTENTSSFDARCIQSFDITRWVTNKTEKNMDKLVNVYQVLAEENCSIALIYTRYLEKCVVTLSVVNNKENPDPTDTTRLQECLKKAIEGNFPGSDLGQVQAGVPKALQFTGDESVAIVSNLATEKSKDFVSQSMEKLLDGFVPSKAEEAYSVVLLAQPTKEQQQDKCRLYELYTALSSFATWQTSNGYNESASIMAMSNVGLNAGTNIGSHISNAIGNGTTSAKTIGESISRSTASAVSESQTKGSTASGGIHVGIHGEYSRSKSTTQGSTQTEASSNTESMSNTEGTNKSNINTTGNNVGANFGLQFSRASGITQQVQKSKTQTLTYTNYAVKHTLELLEKQMKRLDQCSALGMWDFAAYVVSHSYNYANDVAHMYLSLTQGEQSFMEQSTINLWHGTRQGNEAQVICTSIAMLQHPVFYLRPELTIDYLMYPSIVTATTMLSGGELARALNFPEQSVSGLPVIKCVPFGREVRRLNESVKTRNSIALGKIYHMHHTENMTVKLDIASLSSHTFITGSTGTGKSNTIYHLLDELCTQEISFLVIEPAKGEYKNILGGRDDVSVYGTNAKKAPLLQLNPFSFSEDTHVLEHIDRLIEIFNACWPMYAAMPAVLKDAIERAYIQCGWDLNTSVCPANIFPTFYDLLDVLPMVVKESNYSMDTQNDYIGSLFTRIKSLTNGINGQIFCSGNEITDTKLFDKNVIVDLSRIGSMETKALMTGILIMKLQEYRMSYNEMNTNLKHITVLEEAHNLLRRTSNDQNQESSNLQGKSVEMISNAIAEMRSYGEGFIIADQSPELLDPSVIRNTNTKIILRLPDEHDRTLVGKAASLNDDQCSELAKLPLGIAAIYQNDWLEPVLCKIEFFDKAEAFKYTLSPKDKPYITPFFNRVFGICDNKELTQEQVDNIKCWIKTLQIDDISRRLLWRVANNEKLSLPEKKSVAFNLFHGKQLALQLEKSLDERTAVTQIDTQIQQMYYINDPLLASNIRELIISSIIDQLGKSVFRDRYIEFSRKELM